VKEKKLDRSNWGPGPWDEEPEDRFEFRYKGFPCLLVRGGSGAWCGYVGLPPGHKYHGVEDGDIPWDDARVHGGLTYSAGCREDSPICHIPQPGESDDVWWLGFDCAHAGDQMPSMPYRSISLDQFSVYRTKDYVIRQVKKLADQMEVA
jgi:hypothetical protein